MLTGYGKREWLIILAVGAAALGPSIYLHWWVVAGAVVAVILALLSFFRDPPRRIPQEAGAMVSPADGVVSSVHEVERYEPFGGEPATCVRIFLSVLNVHVNRSPCAAVVGPMTYQKGQFISALNPKSAQRNESNLIVLLCPDTGKPVAAVRQVSGAIARRIVCALAPGQKLARGERFGMIKFGSTTELYLPRASGPRVNVAKGQRVCGGRTILAYVAVDEPRP